MENCCRAFSGHGLLPFHQSGLESLRHSASFDFAMILPLRILTASQPQGGKFSVLPGSREVLTAEDSHCF